MEWSFDIETTVLFGLGSVPVAFLGSLVLVLFGIPLGVHIPCGIEIYMMVLGVLLGIQHRLVPVEDPAPMPLMPPRTPRPKSWVVTRGDLETAFQYEIPVNPPEDP